jgi:hypothetical protein
MDGTPGLKLPRVEDIMDWSEQDSDLWLALFPEDDLFSSGLASVPVARQEFPDGAEETVGTEDLPGDERLELASERRDTDAGSGKGDEAARPRRVQLERYRFKRSRRRPCVRGRPRNGRVAASVAAPSTGPMAP